MPDLTVEYLADSEAVTERTSGMFAVNGRHESAVAVSARLIAMQSTHRSERITLAVVMSMTHLAAVTARALCWLRRDVTHKGV
jgi:hypothetical protein